MIPMLKWDPYIGFIIILIYLGSLSSPKKILTNQWPFFSLLIYLQQDEGMKPFHTSCGRSVTEVGLELSEPSAGKLSEKKV